MTEISVEEAFNSTPRASLYGDKIANFELAHAFIHEDAGSRAALGRPSFARIKAFRIGNFCRELAVPAILAVFGDGREVDANDECSAGASTVWDIPLDAPSAAISATTGTLEELLDQAELAGVSGGLTIEDVRYENGSIKGAVHVWAKIKTPVAKVTVNERINFSIGVGGCKTIFDAGIANVEICFEAPNRICAKFCVGKWGISKCWKECATVQLLSDGRKDAEECACK